jgi:hypothetical protein
MTTTFDRPARDWVDYHQRTTLDYELQISQLQRERDDALTQLASTEGELRAAMAGLVAMQKVITAGARLRLELLAENEALRLSRRESGTAEREALAALVRGKAQS